MSEITKQKVSDQEMLLGLQRKTFHYFIKKTHSKTGLVADSTQKNSPASIAATAMGLNSYCVASSRGIVSRKKAREYTLKVLKFFRDSPQGTGPRASGYKGFYYHFLDPKSGLRTWKCELSTIDTALLCAAILTSAEYFDSDHADEKEIREIAQFIYRRIDWQWALNGKKTLSHGWKPKRGFLPYSWSKDYSEAHILYILALGSPTHPITKESYLAWTRSFKVEKLCGIHHLPAGPLFIHQFPQIWLDFRKIRDDFNRKHGLSYFENSRRATCAQRAYAIQNPMNYARYGKNCWGFTASDGPGPARFQVDGQKRVFYGYVARGAPEGVDDGTFSPWAVAASLPFAPRIVLGSLRHFIEILKLKNGLREFGLDASFNPSYPANTKNLSGWVSPYKFGINQGPIVLMIENHLTGLIWSLTKKSVPIQRGLERAGFKKV